MVHGPEPQDLDLHGARGRELVKNSQFQSGIISECSASVSLSPRPGRRRLHRSIGSWQPGREESEVRRVRSLVGVLAHKSTGQIL